MDSGVGISFFFALRISRVKRTIIHRIVCCRTYQCLQCNDVHCDHLGRGRMFCTVFFRKRFTKSPGVRPRVCSQGWGGQKYPGSRV